jgi:cytochrome c553
MKKTLLILLVLLPAIFWMRFNLNASSTTLVAVQTEQENPNGSSELSLLMRDMQKYTNQAKADIKAGKSPAPYPAAFDKIHTAKISDGMEKSDYYKSFGDLYMMAVKNYASSTPENRIETYNNMVAACLACHSQHCPGPVPVIKKMKWEVN